MWDDQGNDREKLYINPFPNLIYLELPTPTILSSCFTSCRPLSVALAREVIMSRVSRRTNSSSPEYADVDLLA